MCTCVYCLHVLTAHCTKKGPWKTSVFYEKLSQIKKEYCLIVFYGGHWLTWLDVAVLNVRGRISAHHMEIVSYPNQTLLAGVNEQVSHRL